ncbi:MAG: IPT/TIG domain-containing protein [Gammaproteobacteria bacterium]
MRLSLLFWLLLVGLVWPLAGHAHNNHNTSTSITCTPNPVVAGGSTTCTLRVDDTNPSQPTQPVGTMELYRGSVAAGNLITSCATGGVPNANAAQCAVSYSPAAAGSETLIAHFVNIGSGAHNWRTSTGAANAARGSTVLTITAAPPAALRVVISPSGQPTNTVAGAAIQRAGGGGLQVEVLDTVGQRVTTGAGATLAITMAIQTNAGGGALSGTLTVNAVAGVATFPNLSINKAGIGYRLRATGAGVTAVNTTTFDITAAAANRFAFAQQPTNTVAGQAIGGGSGVTVRVEDQFGNVVSTDNATQVTVAIAANPGGGTLSGTATATAVAGVASFSNLSINRSGTGYTLQATGTLTAATSIAFDITAGAAARVAFGTPPATTGAGQLLGGGAVTVRVEDAFGNVITGSAAPVTVAFGANPGMTTLQGTLTVNAIAGVATFSNLAITRAATGYTLVAASPGLLTQTSAAFNINAGTAAALTYGQPPTNNEVSAPLSPSVTVRVEDAYGNLVNDTRTINVALAANPGPASLQGTLARAAVAGIATFDDLVIDVPAVGYTLQATTTGGLTAVTSGTFTISAGGATQLAFQQQPTNTAAGSLISPSITVRILDSGGNLVNSTEPVTLSIATNPTGGTLSGTKTVNAVGGVATFSTLSINIAGAGYTLTATAPSLAAANSSAFDITIAPAAALQFEQQPVDAVAGEAISALVGGISVRVVDASGNLATGSSAAVTLTIEFDAGGAGTPLQGTTTVNAVSGVATFPGVSIPRVGTGYTLRASSGALSTATSAAFNIGHAAASKLAYGTHPANTAAGNTITPAVTVRVLDAFDNLVANSAASVSLAIGNNPGGGVLGGNATTNAVNGVASFNSLFINAAGTGYTLSAVSGGLTGATSNAFNITVGSPSKLGFVVQPSNAALMATLTPSVQVAVQDSLGNTITASTAAISLVIASNPGGGELLGTTTVAAINGVATFSNLAIDRTGNGYTLQANSSGLASGFSTGFNIVAGPPAQLSFAQQPMNTAANTAMTPWPSVQVQDAAGNPVAYTGTVTIALGNPGGTCGGALSGTLSVAAVGGVATFDSLQVSANGTGCTLVASSGALTAATSNAFDVLAPGFNFTGVSPDTGPSVGGTIVQISGSGFGAQGGRYQVIFGTANPAPPVTATRLNNNALTVDTPAHPPGLVNVIVIDTFTGGTRALQGVFTYTSATPVKLRFGTQPTDIVAGSPIAPSVTVEVLDVNNNVVNNATHSIAIAFASNLPGGTLLGTTAVNAVNGVATFTNLSVNKVGTGYTLTATATGLTDPPASSAFAVTAGAAAKLAFSQQPTNNDPGIPISPSVQVEIRDAYDNLVTGSNATIDMAIGINAGAGTLSGGINVAAAGGIATFNSLVIDKAGNGYTLIATSAGLTEIESATFDIAFGSASRVVVTTDPGNGVAGDPLTPAIVAQIEDSLGNVIEDFNGPVSIAFHTNPGGASLSGTLTVNAVAGIATFSDVVLDRVAMGYRLAVQSFGLEDGETTAFDIANNVAANLLFASQPADVSQGAIITPVIEVRVVDVFGNPVPNATNAITIGIGTNPAGGALGGTVTRNAVGGVAQFNDLTINAAGDGYTLVASAAGLGGATSVAFNVIGVGGSLNIFSPATAAGAIVGYLPTILAGEDFCVDIVNINDAGTGPENYTNITMTLQMLDASVNTGSLQAGNCRSSWTVVQEWRGIAAAPGDGSRVQVCGGMQGPLATEVFANLNESNVWPNVRFRAFTTTGNASVGCSNDAFAIRPDAFELSSVMVTDDDWQTAGTTRSLILPGAATTDGGPVHAAGRPFRIRVTAVNSQGQPTTNYNSAPRVEVLNRLQPSPCTGCGAAEVLTSGWGQAAGVPGAVRTNQAVFHDAGSLTIRVVDDLFSAIDQVDVDLGLQAPEAGVIVSAALDIGRFVPDNFVVAPSTTPVLRTQGIDPMTCAGNRSFTYVGQSFGYATLPSATVSARSANGAVTTAYQGDLWKLSAAKVLQEYDDNTSPADAATLDTSMAPLLADNATLIPNGNGTGTLTVNAADRLAYEREMLVPAGDPLALPPPPEPFDAFISLTLRVYDDAEAGVIGNEQINTGTPGVFSNMAFDEGNEFRYGRIRLINSVGSELLPLEVPYRFQTWQDVGNGITAWVTETGDNCTTLAPGDFTTPNVEDTNLVAGSLDLTGFTVDSPPASGLGNLTFSAQAPAVTGSFDVFGSGIPSYLQFNWNDDPGGAEVGPTAKAAFGVNEGNPRRIFRSQSFTPRSN